MATSIARKSRITPGSDGSARMGMTLSSRGISYRASRLRSRSNSGVGAMASSSRTQRRASRLAADQQSSSVRTSCHSGAAINIWTSTPLQPADEEGLDSQPTFYDDQLLLTVKMPKETEMDFDEEAISGARPDEDVECGDRIFIDSDDLDVGGCVLPPYYSETIKWSDLTGPTVSLPTFSRGRPAAVIGLE